MSYQTSYVLRCDGPACVCQVHVPADSIDDARERASARGWGSSDSHLDICPRCRSLEGRRARLAARVLRIVESELTDDPEGDLRYIAGFFDSAAESYT